MLIDLLNPENQLSYNIKIAQVIGLHAAVYLSELMEINGKAIRKEKVDEDGYFMIDRTYVTSRTTLSSEEQTELDHKLSDIDVIKIKDEKTPDIIKLDLIHLADIIASDDMKLLQAVTKATKIKTLNSPRAKMTQRQKQAEEFKSKLTYPNPEIEAALKDWVDGVYANPKGFLSYRSIKSFKETVDSYAQGNLDLALKIIEIATINGYRDATWAINLFEKDYKKMFWKQYEIQTPIFTSNTTSLGSEVF